MKNLVVLNVAMPLLLVAAVIAKTRHDAEFLLWSLAFAVILLGLAVTSVVALFVLWKRHGPKALAPLLTLLVVGVLTGTAATYGSRLVLSGTPASPDTFVRGATQRELEQVALSLLSGGSRANAEATLKKYGLLAEVDSVRRVVTFKHYRMRTWYEYFFAADGLPPGYSTAPRLTEADFVNWGTLRLIAEQADPETRRPRGSITFEPAIAVPLMRQALGDSLLNELRRRPNPRPITAKEKALVIAALSGQCSAESRLIANPVIGYEGTPPELHIGQDIISDGFWVSSLLKTLMSDGVVRRAPDGRHLVLKDTLTVEERHRVEWLQAGLLNFICGELLNAHDYTFERELHDRWYFRAS